MITNLFVYGTLRPGDVRWPILAPYVTDAGSPDTTRGQVFDTGVGYPAARFDVDGTIIGRSYLLVADRLDEALAVLDAEEHSVAGGYHRVTVTTGSGICAWAYQYGSGLSLTPIPSNDWLTRSRGRRAVRRSPA
jgi:gamma-glutamylcyclotransferase (GGCT)/AIG2-like uncharacterized protein YtfP